MNFWSPSNFAAVTRGRWLCAPTEATALLRGLSTDSRAVKAGQVFLALKGEKFDGHDFLRQVIQAGAGLLVVSDSGKVSELGLSETHGAASAPSSAKQNFPPILLVPDTLEALQQLAAAYRDELRKAGCKVIAVAGSNGKTTTRNLIHTVLSAKFRGTQSPKSFNNHIGVPLTILSTRLEPGETGGGDAFVVVEIGTNHPGEIDRLGKIVRPDAVVVTSIGEEHLEYFIDTDGVAREEAAILHHLAPGGAAFVEQAAMEHFERLGLRPPGVRCDTYSERDYHPGAPGGPSGDASGQMLSLKPSLSFRLPLLGKHNAVNALAAVAVGRWMGLEDEAIAQALESAKPVEMRLTVVRLGGDSGLTLINDAYNANPTSMRAAVGTLASFPASAAMRRVAILGDMFELGASAPNHHRAVGRDMAAHRSPPGEPRGQLDQVFFIGRLAMFMAEGLTKAWPEAPVKVFPDWDETLPERIAALLEPGDVVLIKASRGMGLERLVPAMQKRFASEAPSAQALPQGSRLATRK